MLSNETFKEHNWPLITSESLQLNLLTYKQILGQMVRMRTCTPGVNYNQNTKQMGVLLCEGLAHEKKGKAI